MQGFRFAGVQLFLVTGLALMQASIWFKKKWGTTLKVMADGKYKLQYSL